MSNHLVRYSCADGGGGSGTSGSSSPLVSLNVGGVVMVTRRSTLTQVEGSMLSRMFDEQWDEHLQRDMNGNIFLDFDPDAFKIILSHLRELSITGVEEEVLQPCVPPGLQPYYWKLVRYLMLTPVLSPHDKFSRVLCGKHLSVSDNGLMVSHTGREPSSEDVVGVHSYLQGAVEFHLKMENLPDEVGQFLMVGVVPKAQVAEMFREVNKDGGTSAPGSGMGTSEGSTAAIASKAAAQGLEYNWYYGWAYQGLGAGQHICYRHEGSGVSRTKESVRWESGDKMVLKLDFETGGASLAPSVSLRVGSHSFLPITSLPQGQEWCLRLRLRHPGTHLRLLMVMEQSA